jgi:quinol monooxygenase YgiN
MIYMVMTFTVTPGHEQAATELLRELVRHARTQSGALAAHLYQSQRDPRHFLTSLQFTDQQAANAYRNTNFYGKDILTNLYRLSECDSFTIETYEPVVESGVPSHV